LLVLVVIVIVKVVIVDVVVVVNTQTSICEVTDNELLPSLCTLVSHPDTISLSSSSNEYTQRRCFYNYLTLQEKDFTIIEKIK